MKCCGGISRRTLRDALAVYSAAQSCLSNTEERAILWLRWFTKIVRTSMRVLSEMFHAISRSSDVPCPEGSLTLSACDWFLWWYSKVKFSSLSLELSGTRAENKERNRSNPGADDLVGGKKSSRKFRAVYIKWWELPEWQTFWTIKCHKLNSSVIITVT